MEKEAIDKAVQDFDTVLDGIDFKNVAKCLRVLDWSWFSHKEFREERDAIIFLKEKVRSKMVEVFYSTVKNIDESDKTDRAVVAYATSSCGFSVGLDYRGVWTIAFEVTKSEGEQP